MEIKKYIQRIRGWMFGEYVNLEKTKFLVKNGITPVF